MKAAARRHWPLLAAFALVFLAGFGSVRFVLDDWCQIPRLGAMMGGGEGGWRAIAGNGWIGHGRVFFLTWLAQGAFARVWGLTTPAPYFLFLFGVHLASCALLRRILEKAGFGARAALFAALTALAAPTGAGELLWTNCWQFVLPVFFLLAAADLWQTPRGGRAADAAALTAAALCAQFSGEQALPPLYAGLAFALVRAPRRAAAPAAACALSLAAYYLRCVRPFAEAAAWSWPALRAGAAALARLHADAYLPFSRYHGGGSIAPSAATVALVLASAAAFAAALLARAEGERRPASRPAFFLAPAAAAVLFLLPVLYGAARGLRGVEDRYAYGSGIALCVLAAAAFDAADPRRKAVAAAGVLAASCCAALSIYSIREVWGAQKRLDERIWAEIDARWRPDLLFVATDSLQAAALIPVRSSAMSDFHDAFGLKCRIQAVHGVAPFVTRRWQSRYDHGDWMYLAAYRDEVYRAKPSQVLPVVFRYGRSYADMIGGEVRAFSNFEDYKKFRASETIEFEPWLLAE